MSGFPFLSHRAAGQILGIWAAWSLLVLFFASAAMLLPVNNSSPWTAAVGAPPVARWDAVWYRSIAVDGYRYDPKETENNVGFYPLYPLAVRWSAAIAGMPVLATGIAVSLLFLAASLLLLGDLFGEWGGPGAAVPGVACLLFFPTSFYFASVYTESLFLLSGAAALWGARRGRWEIAALAGFACSLTRFNGALIAPAIAWYAWKGTDRGERWSRGRRVLAVAGPVLGAAVFPLYLWQRFGDPLLYVHAKIAGWSQRPKPLWTLAADVARQIPQRLRDPGMLENLSFASQLISAIFLVWATFVLFRRKLPAEGLYAALTILLLFESGTIDGLDRYALALFPCFFVLAELLRRRPTLAFAYAFAGIGLGVTFLHRFVHWIMVS